jgi:hypothetical protein
MKKPKTEGELRAENAALRRRLMETTAVHRRPEPLKLDPKALDRFRRPYEGQ